MSQDKRRNPDVEKGPGPERRDQPQPADPSVPPNESPRDPRGVTRQAGKDLERGLQDTDCRGVGSAPDCPPARRRRRK